MRFYLEAISGACRDEGRGFEPRCGTLFFLPNFFSPFLFFPFLFFLFSPLVSFFSPLVSFFSPLVSFFLPWFPFFLSLVSFFSLLSIIPFKLAPPLQYSSIILIVRARANIAKSAISAKLTVPLSTAIFRLALLH